MKILQINSVCGIGSTGKICTDLAQMLENQNHECKIAYGRKPANKIYQQYAIRMGSDFSIKLNAGLTRIFDNEGCNAIGATKKLIKQIRKYNPDIIHLHNLHGYYVNIDLLFKYLKTSNKKVIWTLHDCWTFTGHCPHFDMIGCEKWKTGCYQCPQHKDYPKSYVDRSKAMYKLKKSWFTGVKDMTLVAPSQWLADLAKQSFLQEYPIKVINNGIDLSIFKPTNSDFREKYNLKDKFILLGVAFAWGTRKGLDVFIELAKRLPNDYQIVLVGTDDKIDKQLPENIISIHRTQNQTELAQIYTAADLFVNPTREEALGMVNVETLACGTPVLTFKTGGSPETLDETCGSVVEKDDMDALYKEILRIRAEEPYSKAACLERAKQFDMHDKFAQYIELYKENS